jgi:hypothetical protein
MGIFLFLSKGSRYNFHTGREMDFVYDFNLERDMS